MRSKQFLDKVVIVTGASSGIGRALAIEFAKRGAKVVLAARRLDLLEELATEIPTEAICVRTDVTNPEDCKNLIEQTLKAFGKINVLVNNAGLSMRSLFVDTDVSVLRKLMETNFWGTVYCTKFALPHLLKVKGSIIGISSIAGYLGLPARTGYSASKFAIHGFLETLRIEHFPDKLHVLIACPNFTASEIRKHALRGDGSEQNETPRNESSLMAADEVARRICKATFRHRRTLIITPFGWFTVLFSKFWPKLVDKVAYMRMKAEQGSPLRN